MSHARHSRKFSTTIHVTRRMTETERERRLYSIRRSAKCLVFRFQNRSLDEHAIRSPCYIQRRQYRSRMRYLHKESRRNDFVHLHVYFALAFLRSALFRCRVNGTVESQTERELIFIPRSRRSNLPRAHLERRYRRARSFGNI